MSRQKLQLYSRLSAVILLIFTVICVVPAFADDSEQQYIGVFVVNGLSPVFAPEIERFSIFAVNRSTFPSESSIYNNIMSVFGGAINPAITPHEQAGDLWSWLGSDNSSQTLVDQRDGNILFAGSTVWMGEGEIFWPQISTHPWSIVDGEPAFEPVSVATLSNVNWDEEFTPSSTVLTNQVIDFLRTTDVLHNFAENGNYSVTSWVYLPGLGVGDPATARLVVAVEGVVGQPWSGCCLAPETSSWGELRAMYR